MSNTTEQTKKKADKKANTPNGNGATIEAEAKQDPTETPATATVEAPSTPVLSIESLPEDIQGVLKGFKSQLSAAPPELQQLVASFLFGQAAGQAPAPDTQAAAAPVTPAPPPAPTATPATPAAATEAAAPQMGAEIPSPIAHKFPKRDVPPEFQRLPPLLMYSAAANQYAPVRALAIDVLQWGSRPVIVVLCRDPMFVLNAAGEIVQVPPKTPFAIPAESDLGNFVRPLAEDPGGAYEIFFSPSSIARDDTGLQIVRYEIGIGARVPKAAVTG